MYEKKKLIWLNVIGLGASSVWYVIGIMVMNEFSDVPLFRYLAGILMGFATFFLIIITLAINTGHIITKIRLKYSVKNNKL